MDYKTKMYRFEQFIPVTFDSFYAAEEFRDDLYKTDMEFDTVYEWCKGYDYVCVLVRKA